MKKLLPISILLAASSAAYASETAPLNIKLTNFQADGATYCLYGSVSSSDQSSTLSTDRNSLQSITCSFDEDFRFVADLKKDKEYLNYIIVKNEDTQENVAEGGFIYSFPEGEKFEPTKKYGLNNVNYYHTDAGIEFFLRPAEAIMLFNDENFQGEKLEVVHSLPDLGRFNLNVDSYTIPDGWSLRFYYEKDFNHRAGYFTRGEMRNGIYDSGDFKPRVQSIRVIRTAEDIAQARWEDRNRGIEPDQQ